MPRDLTFTRFQNLPEVVIGSPDNQPQVVRAGAPLMPESRPTVPVVFTCEGKGSAAKLLKVPAGTALGVQAVKIEGASGITYGASRPACALRQVNEVRIYVEDPRRPSNLLMFKLNRPSIAQVRAAEAAREDGKPIDLRKGPAQLGKGQFVNPDARANFAKLVRAPVQATSPAAPGIAQSLS